MKRQFIAVLMTTSFLVVLAISANGQSKGRLSIEVPFSFIVDRLTLKPGQYTIERLNSSVPNALVLKGADGRTVKTFLTSRVEVSEPDKYAKIVFARYGDQYFLSEVWTGESNGRRLARSEAEDQLHHNGRQAEIQIVRAKPAKKL